LGESRRTPYNASDPTQNLRRLTVHDAAQALGISEDAVRMRVKRGTMQAEREGGRLYVLLTSDPTADPTDRTNELLAELRDRVRSLEEHLGQERDANRENRRVIAALTSRIPEIEAPEKPQNRRRALALVTRHPYRAPGGPLEGTQRPWWQRWFGR
jgi:septal ring factor EnvC (AmiA/AmiB activator)